MESGRPHLAATERPALDRGTEAMVLKLERRGGDAMSIRAKELGELVIS